MVNNKEYPLISIIVPTFERSELLLSGKLKEHLLMIQEQAEERMELLTGQMKEREGITEQMKAENQMLWVAKMNSIVHSAEEIVMTELIYS